MNAEENDFAEVVLEEVPRPAAVTTTSRNGSFPLIALLQLASFTAVLVACIDGRELRQEIASANYMRRGSRGAGERLPRIHRA